MRILGLIICILIFILFSASTAHKHDRTSVGKLLLRSSQHILPPGPIKISGLKIKQTGRALNPNNCVCDDSQTLTIIYNGEVGLNSAVNELSNFAIIIDYTNNLVLLLNGQTGVAVFLDYNSNTAYKLDDIWTASKHPFSEYFQVLTSLKPLQEIAKQRGFGTSIKNPSKLIKAEIAQDLTNLGTGSYRPQEIIDFIGKTFIAQLRGPLQVLYKGKGAFQAHKDLATALKLESALGELLANAGDTQSIGILDLGYIFSSRSGVGTFVNLIEKIGEHADLSKVFSSLLTDPTKLARLLVKIENSVSHDGVDGFDSVLTQVVLLLSGKGSIKDTLASLLNYGPNQAVNPSRIKALNNQKLKILDNQFKKYNNQRSLGWTYEYVTRKQNGTLVIANVKISDVINLLQFKNLGEVLDSVFKILAGLLSPNNIPHLIQSILDESGVLKLLSRLIPGLAGHLSVDGILSILSELPIVSWLVPSLFEFLSNVTNTLNASAHGDFKGILGEWGSGSLLGPSTINLLWGLVTDLSNFVSDIMEHLGLNIGNPLDVITGIINAGGALGDLASKTGSLLLGGLNKDRGLSIHTSSLGNVPVLGLDLQL